MDIPEIAGAGVSIVCGSALCTSIRSTSRTAGRESFELAGKDILSMPELSITEVVFYCRRNLVCCITNAVHVQKEPLQPQMCFFG